MAATPTFTPPLATPNMMSSRVVSPTPMRPASPQGISSSPPASRATSPPRSTSPHPGPPLDKGSYVRIKSSLAELVATVVRVEQSFAPGKEGSVELHQVKKELQDPERCTLTPTLTPTPSSSHENRALDSSGLLVQVSCQLGACRQRPGEAHGQGIDLQH